MDYISLAWDKPTDPHIDIVTYEVKYFIKDRMDNTTAVLVKRQNYTFNRLAQQTEYMFQVGSLQICLNISFGLNI